MRSFIVATALLVALTPAGAQTPPAAATGSAPAAQPAKTKPERVICESETEIGSRLASRRVCMTESQWKEHQLRTQGQLDQFHMTTQGRGGSGG